MKKMTSELSLTLSDDALATVSGGHLKKKLFPYPWYPSKTVTQSNSVGDVSLSMDGNSGTISVSFSQSNQA